MADIKEIIFYLYDNWILTIVFLAIIFQRPSIYINK